MDSEANMRLRYALVVAFALLSGCSSLGGGNAPSRAVVGACGVLPADADLSRSESAIIRWCRQGVYLTQSGELAAIERANPERQGHAAWDGGRMPEIESAIEGGDAKADSGRPKPVILKIPEDE